MKSKIQSLSSDLLRYCVIGCLILLFSLQVSADRPTEILRECLSLVPQNLQQDSVILKTRTDIESLKPTSAISDRLFCQNLKRLAYRLKEHGEVSIAIRMLSEAIAYYETKSSLSSKETESLVSLYIPMGAAHEEIGLQSHAMDFYLKALTYCKKYNLENSTAQIYNNIGLIYIKKKEIEKAKEYIDQSLEINKKLGNKLGMFYNYNNMGSIYMPQKDTERTLDYALRAIQLLDHEKDSYLYYFMQSNIASLYASKGDFSLATSYLQNAMLHQAKYGFHADLAQTYAIMANVLFRTGKTDSAFIYQQKAITEIQTVDNRKDECQLSVQLADLYAEDGQYRLAYETLHKAWQLNDSISSADYNQRVSNLEHIYDMGEKLSNRELTIQSLTQEKEHSQRIWIILAVIVVVLAVTISFISYRNRIKEKEQKIHELQAQQQTKSLEEEKNLLQEKGKELNQLISQRNRELTAYTLHKMKTNEFIADITEDVQQLILKLNPRETEYRQQLRQIRTKLQQHMPDNEWKDFSYYFEQVHPSFYQNLQSRFPDLSLKEKRLCAFLRLGLSSKEIAAITFVETRSVESARNRLRKKLNLDVDENLTTFLSSF